MKTKATVFLLVLTIILSASLANAQKMAHDHSKTNSMSANNAAEAFKQFQGLVGKWKATTAKGATAHLEYELVSNGTALHERYTDDGDKDDTNLITMYFLDRDSLMATHYCSLNNQPRYRAVLDSANLKQVRFKMVDATNMADPNGPVMYKFTVDFQDQDHFVSTWVMRDKGKDVYNEQLHWERVK